MNVQALFSRTKFPAATPPVCVIGVCGVKEDVGCWPPNDRPILIGDNMAHDRTLSATDK
jgi:hypothetical protein